jgi:hypothetical protein
MDDKEIIREIDERIQRLEQVKKLLSSGMVAVPSSPENVAGKGKKRTMSAAGRKRIAEAQRKRWAKAKKAK